jgi:hypothetical protein
MKTTGFDCKFSVVCLPESPNLFMMNMQVFQVHPLAPASTMDGKDPEATVWCAVYRRPVFRKPLP